jgi:hypothetical protein
VHNLRAVGGRLVVVLFDHASHPRHFP